MAARAAPPPPINETEHSVSRITRDGKKITYKLNVMQQPERARACGAGAKSSADRRPVDPPPVVEMRIFESDPQDDTHKTDITFAYNANFFLFATLETARPMAQGRLAPAPSCPVLTGVPVAGVAYLDRPSQAGYFIFPDLSVRHEGVYRLSFHLFEQTKDHKDATQGTKLPSPLVPGKLSAPQQFLDFRLEVVSVPFTVYSAKKFPGLTTSTHLSRIIAEQGCRVRIRRDVRMRRRGDKRADNYDYDEERVYSNRHSDRFATPDGYSNPTERPRSTSISTVDYKYDSYPNQAYPRPRNQVYTRQIPPVPVPSSTPIPVTAPVPIAAPHSTPSPAPGPSPALPSAPIAAHPPLHTTPYQSHLSFGSTQTQYPAPQMSHGPQPAAVPTNIYSPRPSISHGRNPSIANEYEPSANHPYPHQRLPNERPSYSQPPTALAPLRLPNSHAMQSGEGHHSLEHIGFPRAQTPSNIVTSLPSLKSLSEFPPASSQPPSSIGSSPGNDYGASRGFWETNQTLSKRTHEDTFGRDDRPLFNGMRPDTEFCAGDMQRRPSIDSRIPQFPSARDMLDKMAYKRANGRMMSFASLRPPDRSVDTDHHEANHQLQRSLESTCRSPDARTASYPSRKHGWSASRASPESDLLSEVSGQFDDAEEDYHYSPLPEHTGVVPAVGDCSLSMHSVKRRRSNDWPRQSADDNESGARKNHSSTSRPRWPFHYHGRHAGSAHGSPRSPRHGRSGRRSRFVEGHMNDTVSEKPPSIFLRHGGSHETVHVNRRQSGIFRFGKAIASAFTPFGGWGSVSEIWRNSQDGNRPREDTNDRLRQAELAYEELKRSGYQGAIKGSYMQSLGADAGLPDETWRAIQEKMNYGSGGGRHSRQSSGHTPSHQGSVSGSSLRPSFPDLRKAKSSLGIASKRQDGMSSLLQHPDGHGQEVRRQKSRREMQRQAKLLKRVSDLEDKLERARRELRELTGEEELLARSIQDERPFQRKFVPGALPSLPSERLLYEPEPTTPLSPPAENVHRDTEAEAPEKGPWRIASQESRSRSASRKRKSPDPESRKTEPTQQAPPPCSPHQTPASASVEPEPEAAKTPPSRKAKLPKTARGDSPGSVERKQKQMRSPAAENTSPAEESISRPLRSTNPRNGSATPVVRVKRGRVDLRSLNSPGPNCNENKENETQQDDENDDDGNTKLDGDEQQDHEFGQNTPTSTSTYGRRKAKYNHIPPVPPLPKDLAATAARVDRRLAREMGKRRVQTERDEIGAEGVDFQWPEDIF
ncbi:velvet factor-domain-containing protein [Aspergillus cavernicola]|uniref:Developmental and secondary metabolism regulator veA n=1 Tax=Aspergillus cavernicola TaxID=176166 RepID=A0ABR4IKV1_9EURO